MAYSITNLSGRDLDLGDRILLAGATVAGLGSVTQRARHYALANLVSIVGDPADQQTTPAIADLLADARQWIGLTPSTSDKGPQLQQALDSVRDAGGGRLLMPPWAIVTAQKLVLYDSVILEGASRGASTIKQADGANLPALVETGQYAALIGGGAGGPGRYGLRSLTLDGNRANNGSAATSLFRGYGYAPQLSNVLLKNSPGLGLDHHWNGSLAGIGDESMEGLLHDVWLAYNTLGNIFDGPHDTTFDKAIAYLNGDAGATSGTVAGLTIGANAGAVVLNNCHSWGLSQGNAFKITADGVIVLGCQAEGASIANWLLLGSQFTLRGGRTFGAGAAPGNYAVGFEIGDGTHSPSGLDIDTMTTNCDLGSLKFTNHGGNSRYRIKAFQRAGSGPAISPTGAQAPFASDHIDIQAHGSGANVGALGSSQQEVLATGGAATLSKLTLSAGRIGSGQASPDPTSTATNWYRLGTFTGGAQGARLRLEVLGTKGFSADKFSSGRTILVMATGNGVSPNVYGYFYGEGGNSIYTAVKAAAVAGATGNTWDVYVNAATFPAKSFIASLEGNGATWTPDGSLSADPGVASATVFVFTKELRFEADVTIPSLSANKLGFFGAAPVAKQTVTGSRGGNAALASLITLLATQGLLTDGSTA